jgi:N-acetyl-gamma-glutamyl-phosphate reductase
VATTLQPAVVGATGYAGFELTQVLLRHPSAKKPWLFGREESSAPKQDLADLYPELQGESLPIRQFDWNEVAKADVLFLATPHELSKELVPQAKERGLRVVDLSGAWRLRDHALRAPYKLDYSSADDSLQASVVYGIPELHSDELRTAKLVANAGCYATSIILALAPWTKAGIIDLEHGVICDSKSGVSGAGKAPTSRTHFVEVAEDFSAYSVFGHRHTGEIVEQLGIPADSVQFTPHLLPIPRGILSTIYVRFQEKQDAAALEKLLRDFYANAPWVRIFGAQKLPQIKFCLRTNYCDIGFSLSPDGRRAVLVSCLDNLVKGAAGQAVQNMNLMFGLNEREGLQ